MPIEALILRRCYPVPITFADLRAAAAHLGLDRWSMPSRSVWHGALKLVTGALDEVYAVVDGRETRVGFMNLTGWDYDDIAVSDDAVEALREKADRDGYWQRPHEVRVDFETTRPTHDDVARAVLIGQGYVEARGDIMVPTSGDKVVRS